MKKLIVRLIAGSIISLILALVPVSAQQTAPVAGTTSATAEAAAEIRRKTFETVWQTINDKHFDPNFNGVDWKAVHTKYAPLVEAVKNDAELYGVLTNMLGELKESHFAIIPPALIDETGDAKDHGDLGIEVRAIDGQVVITSVTPKSSAEAAGLKPGFVLTSIGGRELGDLKTRIDQRKERPQMAKFLLARGAMNMMAGAVGSETKLRYLDGNGESHEASIKNQPLRGEPAKFGNLPTINVQYDAHKLPDGIAYIGFNIFLMPVLAPFQSSMKEFKDARGIIIDLRGNPGGIGGMSFAMARSILRKETLLGTMKLRAGEQRFLVNPMPDAYEGPVVIITDEASASTSEVMAGGLQECGRAIIVGQTTAGAVLPSLIEKLPNGAALQFAIADFKTPKGVLLEGVGVKPDYEVPLTRESLLAGHDAAMEKAIEIIKEKMKKK
jgi:carboxyl-terminal processing protease